MKKNAPFLNGEILKLNVPVLGICYGMQILVRTLKGRVKEAKKRAYGRAEMYIDDHTDLFFSLPAKIVSWMSHTDQAVKLPQGFKSFAHTQHTEFAAIANKKAKIYGVQFHPEVVHTECGTQILSNFLFRICECFASWQLEDFIQSEIKAIREKTQGRNVICGLSGGVDSSTAAVLINEAIGKKLKCIFVNNGLLRKNEARQVLDVFRGHYKIDLRYADSSKSF
jgi:GMP synthase (glutamine-hydrolysing)